MREKPVCAKCGSDDVRADAHAEWSIEKQEWIVCSTMDDSVCEDCEGECKLNWIPVVDKQAEIDELHNRVHDAEAVCQQAIDKMIRLEKENNELKARLEHLARVLANLVPGVHDA